MYVDDIDAAVNWIELSFHKWLVKSAASRKTLESDCVLSILFLTAINGQVHLMCNVAVKLYLIFAHPLDEWKYYWGRM